MAVLTYNIHSKGSKQSEIHGTHFQNIRRAWYE